MFRLLVEYGNFAAFDLCLSMTKHLKPIWSSCIFHTSFVFIVCILHYRIEISSGEKAYCWQMYPVSKLSMYALGVNFYARMNVMHFYLGIISRFVKVDQHLSAFLPNTQLESRDILSFIQHNQNAYSEGRNNA